MAFFERKCMREKPHDQLHDQLTLKLKFHNQFNPHHDQLAAPAPELGGCPRTPSERLWDSRREDGLVNVTIRYSFLPSNPNQELTASRNRQNRLLTTPPARTSKNPTFSTLSPPFHFPIPRGAQPEAGTHWQRPWPASLSLPVSHCTIYNFPPLYFACTRPSTS